MNTKILILIPLLIYLFLSYMIPDPPKKKIIRPWFEPPSAVLHFTWSFMYLLLGYILYRTRALALDYILIRVCVLIFLTYMWGFTYKFSRKYSVIFMMLSLLSAYTVYNSIFLSKLTENESTFELNLISTYIIWLSFVVAIVMSSGEFGTGEISSLDISVNNYPVNKFV